MFEVESARYWLSWIKWGRNVAAFLVLIGVAGDLLVDVVADPLRRQVDNARQEEFVRLTSEAENAKLEQERLKADNLALEKILQPRRALAVPASKGEDLGPLIAEFVKAAGTPVFIQIVPDFEAQVLANDIAIVLQGFHWHVEFVDEARTHVSPMATGTSGVDIFTWEPKDKPPTASTTPEARGWMAGETLGKYLRLLEVDAAHFESDPSKSMNFDTAPVGFAAPLAFGPPRDAVVVYVGMKPVNWMLGVHHWQQTGAK